VRGITVTMTDAAVDFLAREGFDAELGARPLRRAFQRLVADPRADAVLTGRFGAGDQVCVDVETDVETGRVGVVLRGGEQLEPTLADLFSD
jgi:ATP-dependent Clp protease ATP-binding subunit ClpC